VVQGVKAERPTVRTTLTPWAASARLAPGRWQSGWKHPAPAHYAPAVAGQRIQLGRGYAHQVVTAHLDEETIRVFHGNELITTVPRVPGRRW
jgi:hypothetical protein